MFVVVGEKYIHLYDNDLSYLKTVEKTEDSENSQLVTMYSLNYTLVLEEDLESLIFIKWDGSNAPLVKNKIQIGGDFNFASIACLDDSTLCFASSKSSNLHRFDIRMFDDDSPVNSDFQKTKTHNRYYKAMTITDSNLKYLFVLSVDHLFVINPITFDEYSNKRIKQSSYDPMYLATIMSSPLVIVGYKTEKILIYRIDSNNQIIQEDDAFFKDDGDKFKGIIPLRGTRYIIGFQKKKDVGFAWVHYNSIVHSNEIQYKEIDSSFTENKSVAFSRKDDDTFIIVSVNNDNNNVIRRKEFSSSDFDYLKNGGTLSSNSDSCDQNKIYMKDRCYSCNPGSVLIYSENGASFKTTCQVIDTSITKNYFDS